MICIDPLDTPARELRVSDLQGSNGWSRLRVPWS